MHLLKRLFGAKSKTEGRASKESELRVVGTSPGSPNSPAVARTTENAATSLSDDSGFQSPLMPDVSDATKEEIQGIIARGLESGLSPQKVARQIADKLTPYMAERPEAEIRSLAHAIAVTKNAEAYEEGGLSLARDVEAAGIEMEKSWYVSEGQNPCDACLENGQAGWIPLDEAYPSGHMYPPGHPACLCLGLHRMKK